MKNKAAKMMNYIALNAPDSMVRMSFLSNRGSLATTIFYEKGDDYQKGQWGVAEMFDDKYYLASASEVWDVLERLDIDGEIFFNQLKNMVLSYAAAAACAVDELADVVGSHELEQAKRSWASFLQNVDNIIQNQESQPEASDQATKAPSSKIVAFSRKGR